MRTVTIRVNPADFVEQMTAMRLWLDDHRFEPSTFRYSEDGNDIVIDVGFKVEAEAAAFSTRFNDKAVLDMRLRAAVFTT